MSTRASQAADEFVPLIVPEIRGSEWHYVKECLDTGWVSSAGRFVDRFESLFAQKVGADVYAVATVNGTSALHIALLAAGVEPDDEVLVSALTFIAPANAIRYAGAWPVFIDAEPSYWQMDPARVSEFVERGCEWRDGELRNRTTGRRVKAILPVHILGHPVDMDPILGIARKYGLAVIEDGTESLGARYKGRNVGSLGDVACFSFNGNKLITTGGGGMIVTPNRGWALHARHLTTQAKSHPVEYVHDEVGFNYRLTNVQAAIGVGQLENLEAFVTAKRCIAAEYQRSLGDVPGITLAREAPWAQSAFWMYTVLVTEARFGMSSREVLGALEERKIQTRPLWQPLHVSPAHAGAPRMECPVAELLHLTALSLPCSVGLTPGCQQRVTNALRSLAGTQIRMAGG